MSAPDDQRPPPRVAVAGLWHLGAVIAACLAEADLPVVGTDPAPEIVADLRDGRAPLYEPGLNELVQSKLEAGWLTFDAPGAPAVRDAEIVWIAFDTPVDEDDRGDVEWVRERAVEMLATARDDALVVISSQLPVGSVTGLADRLASVGRADLRFACVPENLRLGSAIETFRAPDRFVAGVASERDRRQLGELLERFTRRIEWMSVPSAEMTKHALNAFLATSVAFINEIAVICEQAGADAADVGRGLKSDARIGERAYLSPGDSFAGGTLARDISFLTGLAGAAGLPAHVIQGVAASNAAHKSWAGRVLRSLLSAPADDPSTAMAGRRVALWGVTYKPGTSTLRGSSAIELARALLDAGALVSAYDPAISILPPEMGLEIEIADDPLTAAAEADALVVCTPWPQVREIEAQAVIDVMRTPVVLDAGGHLQAQFAATPAVSYYRVGSPRA